MKIEARNPAALASLVDELDVMFNALPAAILTDQEFEDQRISFVVGNAFHAFQNTDTVTAKTFRESMAARLDPNR